MNKTIQIKSEYYEARGYVLGKAWGGGMFWYEGVNYEYDNLEDLKKELNKFNNDSGFGFESEVGYYYVVRKISVAEDSDGNVWISKSEDFTLSNSEGIDEDVFNEEVDAFAETLFINNIDGIRVLD